jgi:hypothetical protein
MSVIRVSSANLRTMMTNSPLQAFQNSSPGILMSSEKIQINLEEEKSLEMEERDIQHFFPASSGF